MSLPRTPEPLWPRHVSAAIAALRDASPAARDRSRAELWKLLHAALFAALRAQAGRVVLVSREDLEDLASQKALELMTQAEEGTWNTDDRPDYQVAGYVARVARYALVDLARQRGREVPGPEDTEAWASTGAEHVDGPADPEDQAAAREFAVALRECVETLAPRARHAWFRRVFLERPSREIARTLGLSPAHVDVVVQRARAALRECMERRGQRHADVRPGTFVELWRHIPADGAWEIDEEDAHDRE